MTSHDEPRAAASSSGPAGTPEEPAGAAEPGVRVGTVVWGLIVCALAALMVIAGLGIVVLNGTYVLFGLMIGAGAALVVGGIQSARGRDKKTATRKS